MDTTSPTDSGSDRSVTRDFFVLVPSLRPVGPVKGAIALCNALAGYRRVTLVAIKPGPGADASLHPNVRLVELAGEKGWRRKLAAYRTLLSEAGGRHSAASISFCFSADMMNLFCRSQAVICASVRGNLVQNYRMEYGFSGVLLAMVHLASLRCFDHVAAMNYAMAEQVGVYAGCKPEVIGNFLDEEPLECYRVNKTRTDGLLRFVFLASLTPRKQPLLLLRSFAKLRRDRINARLDLIGDGVLRSAIEAEILRLGLTGIVTLHGHLADPYGLVAQADAMVLPSLSEGVPRAGLEALHLGVPCVLRATDGNADLIKPGVNGFLFDRDSGLTHAMLEAANWSRNRLSPRVSLLPSACRQKQAAMQYLLLLEGRL